MDVSAEHSFGWQFQQSKKKLIVPSLVEPPPTLEECKSFGQTISRIARFYSEGEDKQGFYLQEINRERQELGKHQERIRRQLEDLKKFSPQHPRRLGIEEELKQETNVIEIELRARQRAEDKLKVLNQKRNELVLTMNYLGQLLNQHCSELDKK